MFRVNRILSRTIPSRTFFSTPYALTNISASLIKELREQTGAPMMECKKALSDSEVNGNISKAIDWLRAKGIAKATSQTNRISVEGLIGVYESEKKSSGEVGITLVEVNSETDFVARNFDFQKFVTSVALSSNAQLGSGSIDVEKVLELSSVGGLVTTPSAIKLKDILGDITTSIRERIVVRRVMNLPAVSNRISGIYVHGKLSTENLLPSNHNDTLEMGREAAIVTLQIDPTKTLTTEIQQQLHQIAKRLAMHVVAAKPSFLTVEEVPQALIDSETAIFKEQTLTSPPKNMAMLDKIVAGKVNKRLQEISLNGQTHMAVEGGPVVEKYLGGISKELGVSVTLHSFHRWALGQNQS